MTQQTEVYITRCIRVDIEKDPKQKRDKEGNSIVSKFLRWVLDNKVPSLRGGYAGPSGCTKYFPIEVEAQVAAWLQENIPEAH